RLARLIRAPGVEVAEISVKTPLWERLTREEADIVVLGTGDGELPPGLVAAVRGLPDRPEIIVVRPREDAAERARLLASGCLAVLWLGLPDDMLAETLGVFVTRRRDDALRRMRADRAGERQSLSDFIYASPAMQRFLALARRVVQSDSALLILGETGVGKERLARAIHSESPRAEGPFLAVNCGALPESLLESELFGHEEGAFTGATRAHRGYFEMAHRGTIFLDEIGELPPHVQVKLLRILEDRQVRRVGGERSVRVDVRVMAATNRDLEAALKTRGFRSDLYFRLAVVTLTVPSLRERREDIPLLVRHYLDHFRAALGRPVVSVSADAVDALVAYDWPGNVRELINVVERAVLLCHGTELGLSDLPPSVVAGRSGALNAGRDGGMAVDAALLDKPLLEARTEVVAGFERRYLDRLLTATGGRLAETAERAGVNPRTLFDMLQRHGLDKKDYRRR
ncbi:MAG TPA: sigma-54 dependent transcriptional regulator, partial [Vicinamibacterales bacterium]|nr:sigma-54 dependent transcriptional regulator [Vicinamibacterales bacterium]